MPSYTLCRSPRSLRIGTAILEQASSLQQVLLGLTRESGSCAMQTTATTKNVGVARNVRAHTEIRAIKGRVCWRLPAYDSTGIDDLMINRVQTSGLSAADGDLPGIEKCCGLWPRP
ncbi:hypothetical protein FE257_009659 [Aspergillus nanangensis]|uniref:Uncharacterized protein n=1 Tax=Aspergillus nanangensis TaxID=2582783 RepID=A0AAD4CJI6_ASPNN|nr:hypothetical protein FE257_009659 [Aspergillus nanangensis]